MKLSNNPETADNDPEPPYGSVSAGTPPDRITSSAGPQPALHWSADLPDIPAPDKPLKPADLKKWRADVTIAPAIEEKQVVATMGKPSKTEWFRTWVNREDWTGCYLYKKSGAGSNSLHIVMPELAPKMADCVKPAILVPWCNPDGMIGFWPVTIPDSVQPCVWHTSALAIAETARSSWQRMVSDIRNGYYRSAVAENPRPDPAWPEMEIIERLLEAAVGNSLIDSETHPEFIEYMMR